MGEVARTSVICALLAAALSPAPAAAQTKVSAGDGLITFSMPQGWAKAPDPTGGLNLIPTADLYEFHPLRNCGVSLHPAPLAAGQTQATVNAQLAAKTAAEVYPSQPGREVMRFSAAGLVVDGVRLTDAEVKANHLGVNMWVRGGVIVSAGKATSFNVICNFMRPLNTDADYLQAFQEILEKDRAAAQTFLNSMRIAR
jgi:hypothetical protein